MKLSVCTNWDRSLLEGLASIPDVYEVFGSEDRSLFGSARPSIVLGRVEKEEMAQYIKKVHDKGLKFNYTINAPCLNNMEFNKAVHEKMIGELEMLVDMGIDGVTVAIPYLLELIKRRFPKLHVKVSVIAQVNSIPKARFFEEMGADEILLDYMINRDFKLLENIRKSVKCDLSLLLNDLCTYGCAYRNYHYNVAGHASQSDHLSEGFCIDYNTLRCSIERLKNPSLFISSRWIRPEDISCYEDIGYEYFKVAGRRMTADWILNAAKAYSTRKYEGNLSDILDCSLPGMTDKALPMKFENISSGISSIDVNSLMKLYQTKSEMPYIDNNSLEGFIEFFKNDCCTGNCNACNYCKSYTDKVLRLEEDKTQVMQEAYNGLYTDLVESRIFYCSESGDDCPAGTEEKRKVSDIIWPDRVERLYDTIMGNIPDNFRSVARGASHRSIVEIARKRGSNEINEEDVLMGVIKNIPEAFRNNMINGLKQLGVDLSFLDRQ